MIREISFVGRPKITTRYTVKMELGPGTVLCPSGKFDAKPTDSFEPDVAFVAVNVEEPSGKVYAVTINFTNKWRQDSHEIRSGHKYWSHPIIESLYESAEEWVAKSFEEADVPDRI